MYLCFFLFVQILDVFHPQSGTVSKQEIRELVSKQFKVGDEQTIFVFGFKTAFGGQKTTGFACVYDSLEDALENEPKYRLVRQGLAAAKTGTSSKLRKETKNKKKKLRGTEKVTGKKRRKGGDDDE